MDVKSRLPAWVNPVVYVSCALGLLGFLLMIGGLLWVIGRPALAIPTWLESDSFTVGLALFLCFPLGMSVVIYQLWRLL